MLFKKSDDVEMSCLGSYTQWGAATLVRMCWVSPKFQKSPHHRFVSLLGSNS